MDPQFTNVFRVKFQNIFFTPSDQPLCSSLSFLVNIKFLLVFIGEVLSHKNAFAGIMNLLPFSDSVLHGLT